MCSVQEKKHQSLKFKTTTLVSTYAEVGFIWLSVHIGVNENVSQYTQKFKITGEGIASANVPFNQNLRVQKCSRLMPMLSFEKLLTKI